MNHTKHRGKGRGTSGRGQQMRGGHGRPGRSSPLPLLEDATFNVYNNQAITYGIIQCVGLLVDLRTKNNQIYKGILRNMSPTMEVTLELSHLFSDSNNQVISHTPTRGSVVKALVFPWKDVADITAVGCDEDSIKKDSFTDSSISKFNGQVKEKKLQKWQGQDDIPAGEEWSCDVNPTEKKPNNPRSSDSSTETVLDSDDRVNMASSTTHALEEFIDRRLSQQPEQLNDLFIKHSSMTKSDLDDIKKSQDFFSLKFGELVATVNELKMENKELRQKNQLLQERVVKLEKQSAIAELDVENLKQYLRRDLLEIHRLPVTEDKSSNNVVQK